MPEQCVHLLKETGNWDTPYKYPKSTGYTVVDGHLPMDFNKLSKSFKYASLEDLESHCSGDKEEVESYGNDDDDKTADNNENDGEDRGGQEDTDAEEENGDNDAGGRKWKVSRYTNGRLTYLHIKQALKLLLPREYISRSRQRRHWASKYLPGKEPVNPEHDIFKYCNVALRVTQDGKGRYQIGRVEAMESTKDGSEITSFQLKSKASVRIRCSLYSRDESDDEFYEVEEVIGRRLSKDALCYEYKVRFKGYGSEEDMWLPASFFNRPIQFETTSKFGRQRKHTLDPENVIEDNKRGRRSGSDHGGPNALESGNRLNQSKKIKTKREKTAVVASDEHKRSVLSNETSVPLTNRRKLLGYAETRESCSDHLLTQIQAHAPMVPRNLCQLPKKVIAKTLNLRKRK